MLRFVIAGVGLIALGGCASVQSAGRVSSTPDHALFAPEIVAARVTDAYQAVLRLRPDFLRRGGAPESSDQPSSQVQVYLDDVDLGGIEALRRVPLDAVTQIRYVPPNEADLRWAGRHPAGVIFVSTQADPR